MLPILLNTTLCFLDVETTGLDPAGGDRICEIAILRSRNRQKLDSFHSLINPGRRISPEAQAVNGITRKMLIGKPKFTEVAAEVLKILHKAVIVSHNIPFDIGFVKFEIESSGFPFPEFPVIDTLAIARRYFNFYNNSLGNIAKCFGIEIEREHRAMSDVITTEKIFWMLIEALQHNKDALNNILSLRL